MFALDCDVTLCVRRDTLSGECAAVNLLQSDDYLSLCVHTDTLSGGCAAVNFPESFGVSTY